MAVDLLIVGDLYGTCGCYTAWSVTCTECYASPFSWYMYTNDGNGAFSVAPFAMPDFGDIISYYPPGTPNGYKVPAYDRTHQP